jgi:hypothetical protein
LDTFRAPFFFLALIALVLAVAVELGLGAILEDAQRIANTSMDAGAPGLGIRYLAILDFLLLFGVSMIALGYLLPRSFVGRVQGIVALVVSFLGCLGTIALAFAALSLLILMVTLLLSAPFGTIAYIAVWGHFPVDDANVVLALIMFLKLAFCVLLLLAQQAFLKRKGLVLLIALSLGATWLVTFLIGFPPSLLSSIADAIAALIIAIIGIIWLIPVIIGSLVAVIRAIRSAPE